MATNYIIKGFNEVKVEDSVVPSPIFDCFSVTSLQFMAPESTYFSDEAVSPRSKVLHNLCSNYLEVLLNPEPQQ